MCKMEALRQIFLECQHSITSQPRLMKRMINLYLKTQFEKFMEEFTKLLKYTLVHGDKQPAVERTLSFIVKFATSEKTQQEERERESDNEDEEEADPFLENLIVFLLQNHEANSPAVRLRICQLLSMLLRQMGPKAAIDNDLYDIIYDTMLHRLQDKIPGVRKEAVNALTRLQDPHSSECPVIEAYCFHLCKDPNYDVRRSVLNNIAVTYQTLPAILDRIRDTRELVRHQAYKVISQKIHLKSLTIAQRVRLISEGLKDRHEMVRNCVKKQLIPSWLRQSGGKVLDFLTCLDVEASVKEAELVLKTIFELIPFPDLVKNIELEEGKRLVSPSNLRPESALYWRCLVQHLREEGAEEALEQILPDLTHFCSYLSSFVLAEVKVGEDEQDAAIRFMEREFITNQLISMALVYDLSDEVGRRSLDQMVRNLLVSEKVRESLVKGLVEIFSKLHPLSTRINQLAEIISEIREPLCRTVEQPISEEEERKKKLKVASLKVKINQVREELQESMSKLDLEKAQTQKNELLDLEAQLSQPSLISTTTEEMIQEPRNDPPTLIKCLTIFCNIVECSEVEELTPALQTLHDNLILRCLRSEDPAVRNIAVQALGLLCLLSKDLAKQHITLLMQVSKIDAEKIQVTALHCIIDCLHLYGIDEFAESTEILPDTILVHPPEEEEKEECVENGGAIIAALCERLDDESLEIRTLVAEGMCKLLLSSRITSSKLLSRLILMFYNPTTGDDSFLRHTLGVFFPLYACEDASYQESLCEAFMPTLQTLLQAPSRSPLASVDVENVTNFLISITSPTILSEESEEKVNVHDTLVFTLCSEVLNNPSEWLAKVFVRCLNSLHLTPTNFSSLRQLDVLASKMLKVIDGKGPQNTLKRFQQKIQDFLARAPESEEAEENPSSMTEEKAEESAAEETLEDKTETTVIRKKRMLYDQTITDPALLSSEPESDAEVKSPTKRVARSLSDASLDEDSASFGSPVVTSTQTKNEQPASSEEQEKNVTCAAHIVVNSELELTQEENVSSSEGQKVSCQEDPMVPGSQEAPSQGCPKSPQERETSVSGEASESIHESSSAELTSDEEPTPPKVPHLTRRSSRLTLAEGTTSDSSDFSQSSKARRKTKSLPDPLHISSSSSSATVDSRRSESLQKPINKTPGSSRKRSKDLSVNLANPPVSSDESTSDSAVRRATRSKSRGRVTTTLTPSSPSTSNTNSSPSVPSHNTTTDNSSAALKVPCTRSSRRYQTPEATRKSVQSKSPNSNSQSSQDSGSTRRSSRNRKND
ncbi:condensin complex subunit 3-like [Eriocheir sinensis]|uniref:condensin complex subunit 3-like n=1 Tax=Eriocheir sinensis TaxID=95602 RepID=UPI0021CAC78F|nr:condensin complex subunit 3-like [Eriocheir sinensis]XP_050715055.1 condensin complex subunit 3-like [Eriocheir sinensis]XP_050715056.1 condensin complex subunit 3-like [Eriocheir sinensis]